MDGPSCPATAFASSSPRWVEGRKEGQEAASPRWQTARSGIEAAAAVWTEAGAATLAAAAARRKAARDFPVDSNT